MCYVLIPVDRCEFHQQTLQSFFVFAWSHSFSSSDDLINQEKLLGKGGCDVEPLLLGAVVVVDLLLDGGDGAQGLNIQANCNLVLVVFVLELDNCLLDIVSTVFSKGLYGGSSTLGMTRRAYEKAWIPSLALPCTSLPYSLSLTLQAISKEPAPGTTALSSKTFLTALSPSLVASLIMEMVCSLGPLMRMVQERGFFTPEMKVYFSSPKTCSSTLSAQPRSDSFSSSTELTASPPQASTILSMFLLLALRRAMMPCLANISRQMGSIPFQLITTKLVSLSLVTLFFNSTIFWHRSSVNLRSLLAILSLSPALEKKNWELTSVFSYSRETLQVRMWHFSSLFGMSGCLAPWSSTNPSTSWVSLARRCTMCMISIMWRSMGFQSILMISTALTTMSTNWLARSGCNLVHRAVLATLTNRGFSGFSFTILNSSKNLSASLRANSYPSVMILGCTCSWTNLWACFIISPMRRTLEVVPSPTISSCAVADRAIMPAVGCCICIS